MHLYYSLLFRIKFRYVEPTYLYERLAFYINIIKKSWKIGSLTGAVAF